MKSTLTLALLFFTLFGYSQNHLPTQKQAALQPSNQSLYQVEFELKDYVFINGDSTILNAINLGEFAEQRDDLVDQEIYHSGIDQTIVLYSLQRIRAIYEGTIIGATENDN